MKAVFVEKKNKVTLKDVPTPEIGDGDVLVKMHACGLCGSDLEKVYGQYGVVSMRLGHEPAGEIVALGKNVKDLKVGDRVFVHHHVACYSCHYCKHEDYTMCLQYQKSNLEPCGLAEMFLVPEWNVNRGGIIKLPDNVSFEEAAMIEPLACCIRAINKSEMKKGDDVAIVGVGPAGIMHMLLAKIFGAGQVFAVDINEFRLNFAAILGHNISLSTIHIDTTQHNAAQIVHDLTEHRGADIAIVATGSTKAILESLKLVRSGGKVIMFGVPSKGSTITFDASRFYSNEIKLIPIYAASEKDTNQAFELISSKKLDIKPIITHRFTLERAQDAIKCAHEAKDAMKVVVTS